MTLVLTTLWTVSPLALWWLVPSAVSTNLRLAGFTGGVFALIVALAIWARESMSKTLINRRVLAFAFVAVGSSVVAHLGGHLLGLSARDTLVVDLLLFALGSGLGMFILDWRFIYSTVAFTVAFFVAAAWPELVMYGLSAGNLALMIVAVSANRENAGGGPIWGNPHDRSRAERGPSARRLRWRLRHGRRS